MLCSSRIPVLLISSLSCRSLTVSIGKPHLLGDLVIGNAVEVRYARVYVEYRIHGAQHWVT